MTNETRGNLIQKLDGMIATLQQAVVIGGRSDKESLACELLKDARLLLVEEMEQQEPTHYKSVYMLKEVIVLPGDEEATDRADGIEIDEEEEARQEEYLRKAGYPAEQEPQEP